MDRNMSMTTTTNMDTELTPALPSYAKPTTSSRTRRGQPSLLTPTASPTNAKQSSVSPARSFQSSLNFKTAYLSTSASRRRCAISRFRFFDLPPDIRNIIYSYHIRSNWPWSYVIDLRTQTRQQDRKRHQKPTLPLLMRVKNKQLREEVGSYYFTQSITIYWVSPSDVIWLLREIGQRNCERLVHNPHAWLIRKHPIDFAPLESRCVDGKMLERFLQVDKLWLWGVKGPEN